MLSVDEFTSLELEFIAYLRRPYNQRNVLELLALLRRYFPLAPISDSDSEDLETPAPAELFSHSRSKHNLRWVPEYSSMASRKKGRSGRGSGGRNQRQPRDEVPANNNPAATYASPQPEPQPHQAAHPHPTAGLTGGPAPLGYAPQTVLPPISSILQPPNTITPPHPALATSAMYMPYQPVIFPQPSAPLVPPAQLGLTYPPAATHARTGSITSAYSHPHSDRSHAVTLTSSVPSGPSSDAVRTPDTSSAGRGQVPPWQPAYVHSAGSLGQAQPSVPDHLKAPLDSAFPLSQPHPAPVPGNISAPNPNADADEEDEEPAAPPGKATRAGGDAYPNEAECKRIFERWRVRDDGRMMHYFFKADPTGAGNDLRAARLDDAMQAIASRSQSSAKARVFLELAASEEFFAGTVAADVIASHFAALPKVLAELKRYTDNFGSDVTSFSDENELLQRINRNVEQLRASGLSVKLHPWRILNYLRHGWYHWLRVSRIAHLPAARTSTEHRSGAISPASAPSHLPTQPLAPSRGLQPSAPSQASSGQNKGGDNVQRLAQPPSAPAQGNTSGPGSRNPSISALRAPREPSAGRLARNSASGSVSSAASARPSRYSRTGASDSAPTPTEETPSEGGPNAVGNLSRVTHSDPLDISGAANAEVVRATYTHLDGVYKLRKKVAEKKEVAIQEGIDHNKAMHQLTYQIVKDEHEQKQRINAERALHEDQVRLDRMRIQVDMLAVNHVIMEISRRLPEVTSQVEYHAMLERARFQVAQSLGYPLSVAYPGPAPLLPPPMPMSYAPMPYAYMPLPPVQQTQAGPSNHTYRLCDVTPTSGNLPGASRFEDLGTIAGTPRTTATRDDEMDVESLRLHDGPDNNQDHQKTSKGKGPVYPHDH
ncbi:hypothetical protein FRC07_003813 [Ceratobasidium sp. 392]|nr:hypothetical protein FRC07_003813 [Ceratobasidium sp. 392]